MGHVSNNDLYECCSPNRVAQLFNKLGYPVESDLSPLNKQLITLSQNNLSHIKNIFLIADLENRFKILFLYYYEFQRQYLYALSRDFMNRPDYYMLITTDNRNHLIFVNIRKVSGKIRIYKLFINTDNPTRHDLDVLNSIEYRNENPDQLYLKHCEAFSTKRVTKKFYKEYKKIFKHVQDHIKQRNPGTKLFYENPKEIKTGKEKRIIYPNLQAYTQRLLGRVMFLYFLQRKGWLGSKTTNEPADGDLKFLTNQYKKIAMNDGNYWHDFLSKLFFETLNKDRRHQEDDSDWGKIPYLNGGLFERDPGLEPKEVYIDNEIFDPDVTDGDGNQLGILAFFNSYNFTIEEKNIPESIDIALDPELLGKVFENMLEEKERQSSGTFYTPGPIVQFMCRESLTIYLHRHTNIEKHILYQLFEPFEKPLISVQQGQLIEKALKEIRILDPAVGSGAYLVTMLHEIANILNYCDKAQGGGYQRDSSKFARLKKEIIENNLYGVDLKPEAVEISKLRLWLSLVVEIQRNHIELLPNLDFKIMLGNSLVENFEGVKFLPVEIIGKQTHLFNYNLIEKLKTLKQKYFHTPGNEQHVLSKHARELELKFIRSTIKKRRNYLNKKYQYERIVVELQTRQDAKKQSQYLIKHKKEMKKLDDFESRLSRYQELPFFLYRIWFNEVFTKTDERPRERFDIVIGNPPYGVKVTDEVRDYYFPKPGKKYGNDVGMQSKDSYGIFYARALQLLTEGGVLSFITSDTWQTIKSHKPLRKLFLDNVTVHHLLSMPDWVFGATVNTSIFTAQKLPGKENQQIRDQNMIYLADFTRLPNRDDELLEETLNHQKDPSFIPYKNGEPIPTAHYQYPQSLIRRYSGNPFFIGSLELYKLMFDNRPIIIKEIGGNKKKKIPIRQFEINAKTLQLVKLGDIAEIKVGLQTGDNQFYLRKQEHTRGSYQVIDMDLVLSEKQIENLSSDEKKNGIDPEKYNGKHFLPYDKGGEFDAKEGWLPNYYVPTDYFIDWSKKSVQRLKSYKNKKGRTASRFQNKKFYFKNGIFFSGSGIHNPTFRKNFRSVFDQKGSCIFSDFIEQEVLLSILCSKFICYMLKVFINHTIRSHVDSTKEILICLPETEEYFERLKTLTQNIIKNQKVNPSYPYYDNEQKQIDKLIYQLYCLSEQDIAEIENWYQRRYPLLSRV